jgi:DNA replication protein DnaC
MNTKPGTLTPEALAAAQHAADTFPHVNQARPADTDVTEARPRTCDDCGATAPYHPILCMGRDISAALPFHCDACEEKAREAERQKAREAAIAEKRRIWESTIPEEYRATDIDHPDFDRPRWERIRSHAFLAKNLGLIGSPGRCKTRFLALFAKRAIYHDLTVAWANPFDLEELALRKRNHRHYDDAAREIRHLKTSAVLFLDDLGKSRWTATLEALLFEILEARYSARRVTHWSLNPQPEDEDQPITSDLLADALDPEGTAAGRNRFAPILSRLQSNTVVVPV